MSDGPDIPPLPEGPATSHPGEWLRGEGPESDIALCTRARFARNVQGFRFSTGMDAREAAELDTLLRETLSELSLPASLGCEHLRILELTDLPTLQREQLVERHLISREHAHVERPRSVAHDDAETVSIMVNEEDHLRSQVFRSGLRVDGTYQAAEALDDALLGVLPIAFSEEFGFLAACPTNVGTGLRISVMLHLPGLVWGEEIERAAHSVQKIQLAVRGLYGEGSRTAGDFYQVSNQITLGRSERRLLDDVNAAVHRLVEWERQVRKALLTGRRENETRNRVARAEATLRSAVLLSSAECLESLSALRFGVHAGLIDGIGVADLNRILLLAQPAHLQQVFGERLGPQERDECRARLVRRVLGTGE